MATRSQVRFAAAFTEDLITELAAKPIGLRVIARNSVEAYAERAGPTCASIARDLGVTHVVEGSLELPDGRASG